MVRVKRSSMFAIGLAILSMGRSWAEGIGDVIPANAKIVASMRNVKAAAEHVHAFANAIGVPIPQALDVAQLGALSGLGDAWSMDQGLAIVAMDVNERGLAVIFPVADAKAALAKLGAKGEGEVQSVNFPPGKPGFAMSKGNYLIIAPTAETLAAFKSSSKTLGAEFTKDNSETDLYVAIHIRELRPQIEQAMQMGEAQLANLPIPPGQGDPEMILGVIKWYFSLISQMAKQTDGLYFSFDVSKDKFELEASAEFTEGSYCAKKLGNIAGGKSVLKGLPNGPFAFAMGMQADVMKQLMADGVESMMAVPALSKHFKGDQREKFASAISNLFGNVNSMSALMGSNEAAPFGMLGTYGSADPAKLRTAIRETTDLVQSMTASLTGGMTGSWSRRSVGDIEVDEFTYDFSKMPEEQKKMMQAMYGPDAKVQMGIVGGAMRFGMGGKDPILAFKNAGSELADDARNAAVLADLPKDAPMIVLVDIFGYGQMILKMVANGPTPIPLPPIAMPKELPPPLGAAMFAKNNSMYKHIVIRAETVRAVVDTVKKSLPQ